MQRIAEKRLQNRNLEQKDESYRFCSTEVFHTEQLDVTWHIFRACIIKSFLNERSRSRAKRVVRITDSSA